MGRKEHNGRVERSHRTDDEEFYLPFLGKVRTEEGFLNKAAGWVYYYSLERPHYGEGMDGKPPFRTLRELGYDLPEEFGLFPPLVLDRVSADWALGDGNDLLAHYSRPGRGTPRIKTRPLRLESGSVKLRCALAGDRASFGSLRGRYFYPAASVWAPLWASSSSARCRASSSNSPIARSHRFPPLLRCP